MILESVGMPMINEFLAQGLPIPVVAGIGLVDPLIQYYDGLLLLLPRLSAEGTRQTQTRGEHAKAFRADQ